jgi:hypothetical protein
MRAKRKVTKKRTLKPSDFLKLWINYCEEFLSSYLGYPIEDEITAETRDESFGIWLLSTPHFSKVPTNSELETLEKEEQEERLRAMALVVVAEYFGTDILDSIPCVDGESFGDKEAYDKFFENEEWAEAAIFSELMHDESDHQVRSYPHDSKIDLADAITENAIAQNAVDLLAKKVEEKQTEEEAIPDEELVIGLAEETGIEYPEIPADVDSSVDEFMSEIEEHVHDENCMHSHEAKVPVIAHTHDAVPWATLAAIEKHKNAIANNENSVLALANGVEELVDNGGVQTKRGLLDAILILIEAKPAEALRIVASWEKLN